MNERDLIQRRLYIFLSVFVVVIMTTMGLAGAVQQESSQIGGIDQEAVPTLDESGVADNGRGVDIINDDPVGDGSGAPSTMVTSDEIYTPGGTFDPVDQDRLADKILGNEVDQEEHANNEFALFTSEYDLQSYNELVSSSVSDYIKSYGSNNGETHATDADSSYTNNLYNSVSEYLSDNAQETYVPVWQEMAANGYGPEREEVDQRTIDTKIFRNDDGTNTAILNQQAIHYKDLNGEWQDVDLTLRTSREGGYEVVKNNIQSYFAADSSAIRADVDGNSWFKWTPTAQVYTDAYGLSHDLSDAQGSSGKVEGNTIVYEDTFANTDEEYIVNSDNVKHNLILSTMPDSAIRGNYLSYVGKVELADGLSLYIEGNPVITSMETRGAIEVRNLYGEVVYTLPTPVTFEQDDQMEMVEGSYSIEITEDGIYLSLNTPIDWLIDPDRQFPIVVDPNIYVTLNVNIMGHAEHQYYKRYSSPTGTDTYNYNRYPRYTRYYAYIGGYVYTGSTYSRTYTRRAYFDWNTAAIPDSNTVTQIDFHGKGWRTSYIYDYSGYKMLVNIRDSAKDIKSYSYYGSQASKKEFFNSMTTGSLYNSSVDFGTTRDSNVDVYALGGAAVATMQANLVTNKFQLNMERTLEMFLTKPGYGYFYPYSTASNAQLYVSYDPCPIAPIADTGGPYMIPEGVTSVKLDASDSIVCSSSVFYNWDTDEDGIYDLISVTPTVTWPKAHPDQEPTIKLTLMIDDKVNGKSKPVTTTFTVYNVHPRIVTPSFSISGKEGQTLIIPKIEFTDPGADTWTYAYDMDGDDTIDKSGSTVDVGGKHYVPSVSWYFCDDAESVSLTVEDEDGGFSDALKQTAAMNPDYDGYIREYKRPASSYEYYYRNIQYRSSSYPYLYVRSYSYVTSYDYDYRGLLKFDTSALPSSFTPTKVSVRSMLRSVSYGGGKMGVVGLSTDINAGSGSTAYKNTWTDAGAANILATGNYVDITSSMAYNYLTIDLDPKDFNAETNIHSNWYGVAYNTYEKKPMNPSGNTYHLYTYFYGGSYNTLTVTDGTSTYTLRAYDYTSARNGMSGYVYQRTLPARDSMTRSDTSTTMYVEDYTGSYSSTNVARSFMKFGDPNINTNKIVGGRLKVYLDYVYGYYYGYDIKVGINDIDSDPETASDSYLFTDMASSNVHDDTPWAPNKYDIFYTLDLNGKDLVDKYKANGDWYAVGMEKISGLRNRYMYMRTNNYYSTSYRPELTIDYRVPYQLAVDVINVDPVMDTSKMVVSPTIVNEGDTVKVSGITYTDEGPCDTHYYRVSVPITGQSPLLVVDWTEAKDGKLDFSFEAPDDDPEDADLDISKDKITLLIEFKDDDFYVPGGNFLTVPDPISPYNGGNTIPWGPRFASHRYQQFYGSAKLGGQKEEITSLSFYYWYTVPWSVTYTNLKIYLSHKSSYGLSNTFASNYGTDRTLVLNKPSFTWSKTTPEAEWKTITLDNTFKYNGVDHLVMEVSFPSGTNQYLYFNRDSGGNDIQRLWAASDTATSGSTGTYGLFTQFEFAKTVSNPPVIQTANFDLIIKNVAPILDTSGMKMTAGGVEVTTVKEGQNVVISDIKLTDPALFYTSEVFEYRMDLGSGIFTPWTLLPISVSPGTTETILPSITMMFPDDHPTTGTSSDLMTLKLEVREDDGGTDDATADITVENVAPELDPGTIYINGKLQGPNILVVSDAFYWSAGYNPSDTVNALKANGQRPNLVTSRSTTVTLAMMNQYDMVFWNTGSNGVRYELNNIAERTLLTSYINGGGKLVLSGTYWYNSYSWGPAFYAQFGISTSVSSYYLGTRTMEGTGGAIGNGDKYTLARDDSDLDYPWAFYPRYVSRLRMVSGGIAEFKDPTYTTGRNYFMVHKDSSTTGSIALAMGFDMANIDNTADQNALMKDILDYFGIKTGLRVEINEGDEVQFENFNIVDPARGVATETFKYQVEWGDGDFGALTDTKGTVAPTPPQNYEVIPPEYENSAGGVGYLVPLWPGWSSTGSNGIRYQQLYPASELGGSGLERDITIVSTRSVIWMTGTPWTNTYKNFKMYLSHETASQLDPTFMNNFGTDRTLVFTRSTLTLSHPGTWDWVKFALDSSFKWDGKSNVVMEISWESGTASNYRGGSMDYGTFTGMDSIIAVGYATSAAPSYYVNRNAGLVTNFTFKPLAVTPDTTPYTHLFRDDPCSGDEYTTTIHVYDDDLGHGTLDIIVKVNNVKPTIDPLYVMPLIIGKESGSPSVLLPQVPFSDPGTQAKKSGCEEKWSYWWDLDNNGIMNNAPDVIGTVPSGLVNEINDHSYGKTPMVMAVVNDDYLRRPVALYLFDDDMPLDPASSPDSTSGTMTVNNVVPTASIEAFIPVEVRVRMSGTRENDLRVSVIQTNPQDPRDVLVDEMTIERAPGQPKENPFSDGSPSAPLLVNLQPDRIINLEVTFDATADSNDVYTNSGPNGADPVYVYLDFPKEDDYDPADDSQSSSQGHHWIGEYKFNVQQDGAVHTETTDISKEMKGKKGTLIGHSDDDSSDDAMFNWAVLSGSSPLPYMQITYYNDGSTPQVGGPFTDPYPSPWDGTAPIHFEDVHEFVYANGFSVALYIVDDDGGVSTKAILTLS